MVGVRGSSRPAGKHRAAVPGCQPVSFLRASVLPGFLVLPTAPSPPHLVSPDARCQSLRTVPVAVPWGSLCLAATASAKNNSVVVELAPRVEWGHAAFSPFVPAVNAPIDLAFWIPLRVAFCLQSWVDACLKRQSGS